MGTSSLARDRFTFLFDNYNLSRSDAATFRKDLMNIARTTLSSKVLSQDKDYFSNLAVDAVLRLKVRECHPRWL
jgi:chaperonin GroEL (HSP60 family)